MYLGNGIFISTGDFNKDGHLDLIVAGTKSGNNHIAQLYFFEGDGKDNFTLKKSYKPIDASE